MCRAQSSEKGPPATVRPADASYRPLSIDLYDYDDDPPPAERRQRRAASPHVFDVERLPVVDDWPDRVPVTTAEIDIFERYFGDVLDRMFGLVEANPGNERLPPLTSNGNGKP